jgi:ubiquitin-conjugating enzyme E2 Q
MDRVDSFLENGDVNSENFFLDEDSTPPNDATAAISVGGRFTFFLDTAALKVHTTDPRGPVKQFVEVLNRNSYRDVTQFLQQATREASKVSEDGASGEEYAVATDAFDVPKPKAVDRTEFDRLFDIEKAKFEGCKGNKGAIERIMSDYQKIFQSKLHTGWTACPQGDNLFLWNVELNGFEKGTPLYADMNEYKKKTGHTGIDMLMTFPQEYPFKPPFIRVLRPRFMARTGHVTIGGSICTELLVDEGWKPINDIESILTTIHVTITDKESGGRIDFSNTSDYTEGEATEAFHRVAAYHKQNGW